MNRTALCLTVILAGCVPAPRLATPAPTPHFDAIAFFDGTTRGDSTLRVALHAPRHVRVDGHGHVEPDGTLVLDQDVQQEGKPPTHRQWHIRAAGTGRYTGTLSDAAGPVEGRTDGDRLTLKFRMKGGLAAAQYLTLAADRQSAHNVMEVRKFGMTVAVLDETIRKAGNGG